MCDNLEGDRQLYDLLKGNGSYNNLIPPNRPVKVHATFVLNEVTKFDEIDGIINVVLVFIRIWTDQRLRLNCVPPGGKLSIPLQLQDKIWQPEIFIATASSAEVVSAPIQNQRMELDINGKCRPVPTA